MFSLPCEFSWSDPNKVLYHTLNCQWTQKNDKFGIRQKLFDKSVGTLMYRNIHFGVLVSDIKSEIQKWTEMLYKYPSKKSFFQKIIAGKKLMKLIKLQITIIFLRVFKQIHVCMNFMNSSCRSYPSLQ